VRLIRKANLEVKDVPGRDQGRSRSGGTAAGQGDKNDPEKKTQFIEFNIRTRKVNTRT
jgi:hypothetical protein